MPISFPTSPASIGYVAIAVPWLAAIIVALYGRHVRIIGFLAALLSVVTCALRSGQWRAQALLRKGEGLPADARSGPGTTVG